MKKIRYIYGIMGCLLIILMPGLSSCNDKLADELFMKNSYIVHNGWQEYALEVTEDNTAILPIYFGVNGTSGNDKDIVLTVELDPDTLAGYNWDKYKNQTNLYYKILPEEAYTFGADTWTIPKGELKTTASVKIDLNKIEEVVCMMTMYFRSVSLLRQVNLWGRINILRCWHILVLKMITLVPIVVKELLRSKVRLILLKLPVRYFMLLIIMFAICLSVRRLVPILRII